MYSNKLAVAIMASGKPLREFKDEVFLPFNTEYSIFLKNKNLVRASVKIEIDGIDVTEGISLIVDPNDTFELERFIKSENLVQGNRFKFIKRTSKIEQHRGSRIDDGLIRITFRFEKKVQQHFLNNIYATPCMPSVVFPQYNVYSTNILDASHTLDTSSTFKLQTSNISSHDYQPGITTPGSISNQEFKLITQINLDETEHIIILKLIGEHNGKSVSKTVSTRIKTKCTVCGYITRSSASKFCQQCGTSLQIID